MYDAKGIDKNVEALVDFSNNFKRLRDAKPTAEEQLIADMRMMKILKKQNIPVGIQLQSVNDNFNDLINKTVAGKVNSDSARTDGAAAFLQVPKKKE